MKLIDRVDKRTLRTIHDNFNLDLVELFIIENISSIHKKKHLRMLMVEVYHSAKPKIIMGIILFQNNVI